MDIDLNEEHYDYEELLNLFCLRPLFTKEELKQAKKKVLCLHPDKCDLPVEYYLFFRKMYHKVEEIHRFSQHAKDEGELTQTIEAETHFKDYLERNQIDPKTNYALFSKEFNKMFEKVYVDQTKETGHGEWLKSKEDMHDKHDLEASRTKAIQNAIVPQSNEIEETGLLSKQSLQSFDVKESHANPFFALDVKDIYEKKPKFKSVQEYQHYRKEDEAPPPSESQSEYYLKQKEEMLQKQSHAMAYEHLKHKEQMNDKYKDYITKYLSITD